MTKKMIVVLALGIAVSAAPVYAQTADTSTTAKTTKHKKTKVKPESETERQVRELREMQEKLQVEVNDLKQQLADKDAWLNGAAQKVQDVQAQAADANAKAAAATETVQQTQGQVTALQGQVTTLQTTEATDTAAVKTLSDQQKKIADEIETPMSIRYKGVNITPSGFLAAETVYRSKALNSDINTPFSSTPYGNVTQAYLSEFNASGRQSRLAVLVDGKTPWGHMGGYYEMDFLSAGVTSNDNQSNSYTLRQRQAWGQFGTETGFTFTGGQMWSLVTEVKKGINSAPGIENLPNTIDAQYHVGFSWTRQPGVFAGRVADGTGEHDECAVQLHLRRRG
jgi:hypothetical protein